MPPRFAYWIPGQSPGQVLRNPPARITAAWPNVPGKDDQRWMTQDHPQGGTLLVFPRYDGAAVTLEQFGTPRPCADGMTYYPSREEASHDWLIRPEENRPAGEWTTLYGGLSIFVAIAFVSPRRLIVLAGGGSRRGEPVSEFGRLGHEIWPDFSSKAGMPPEDARIWRFLFLALRESYWVTEEQLEDLTWLVESDANLICQTALGCNPKQLADARERLRSSAPATPTSP